MLARRDVPRGCERRSLRSMTGLQQPSSMRSLALPLRVIFRKRVWPTQKPANVRFVARCAAAAAPLPSVDAAPDADTDAAVAAISATTRTRLPHAPFIPLSPRTLLRSHATRG